MKATPAPIPFAGSMPGAYRHCLRLFQFATGGGPAIQGTNDLEQMMSDSYGYNAER